jgi:hypothetical protein
MVFQETTVPIRSLLLDPNNYRYQDEPGFITADERRFHEESVQDRAARRLRREGLVELKNSIVTNGFISVERIAVRPYKHVDGLYVVVEGNRRLAALRWIEEDHGAGVPIPDSVLAVLEAVPVLVIPADSDESVFLSIMGIRHVGGIRQWGGYQRAKLVTELRDTYGLEPSVIGGRLGMSTQEVNRRYRAFKALGQMQSDLEYGDRATPSMYANFNEAVALPAVREWLRWDDGTSQFADIDALHQFYELIAPSEDDEGSAREPKITIYSQVRQLRNILAIPEAKRVLLNPERSFEAALGIAKADELSRSWATQVAETVAALKAINWEELVKLSASELDEVQRLRDVADELIKAHSRIVRDA